MRHLILFLLAGVALAAGCSSTTNPTDGGSDATSEPFDLCSQFTSSGDPCPKVSATVCFPECTNGGCKCVQGASGPVWECTTDTSCMPCAGPLDDGSADCGSDASPDAGSDASSDAGDDAADASDAAQE